MTNAVFIVGRINNEPEIINDKCILEVRVQRPYKEENEEYESDLLNVAIIGQMASNVQEYCHKEDLIGVKGHLEKMTHMIIVAEKVTFLSSKKEGNNNE